MSFPLKLSIIMGRSYSNSLVTMSMRTAGSRFNDSGLKAASYRDKNSRGGAALNYDNNLQLRAAVESTPSALYFAVGKEM